MELWYDKIKILYAPLCKKVIFKTPNKVLILVFIHLMFWFLLQLFFIQYYSIKNGQHTILTTRFYYNYFIKAFNANLQSSSFI